MSLKRVNFSPLHTFARATVKNVFQPEPDGFGGTDYILKEVASGAPAFEWNPETGESLGISIEESRTNIATRNKADANALATWTKTNVTVGTVADPQFGNVIELTDDATSGSHAALFFTGLSSGATYARSVRFKKPSVDGVGFIRISARTTGDSGSTQATFDASTGALVSGTLPHEINSIGGGWLEAKFATTASSSANNAFYIGMQETASDQSYIGVGSKLLIALPQMELGPSASTPIITEAATVTRLADVCSIDDLSGWFNPSEGTFVVEFDTANTNTVNGVISTNLGTNGRIFYLAANDAYMYDGVNAVKLTATPISRSAKIKAAIAITPTGVKGSVNSQAVQSGSHNGNLLSATSLQLGRYSASNYINGSIANIQYYPQAVSNTQLQELSAL